MTALEVRGDGACDETQADHGERTQRAADHPERRPACATGALAGRQTKTETELGAKLDSIADLTLAVICLAKILPTVAAPAWLWAWVTFIAVVKVANMVSGLVMRKRLVMPHTVVNKVAGFVAFLVLFAIPTFGVVAPSIPACVVTTFAAVQESHLIRTGHN